MLFEEIEITIVEAFFDIRQLGEVKKAGLVQLPTALFQHKLQHKGVFTSFSITKLQFTDVRAGHGLPLAAHERTDVDEVVNIRGFLGVAEEVFGELPALGDDEVAHLHLTRARGAGAPSLFITANHAQAPSVVDRLRHLASLGLIRHQNISHGSGSGCLCRFFHGVAAFKFCFNSRGSGCFCCTAKECAKGGGLKKNCSHNCI